MPSLLTGIDFLFTTEEEIKCLFQTRLNSLDEMLLQLLKFGARNVIVNMDAGYTLILKEDQNIFIIPEYEVHVLDPIGEYDCFCGAFTASLNAQQDLRDCALFAAAAASVCKEGSGIKYLLDTHLPILDARAELLSYDVKLARLGEIQL
jgi:sugar/nucleoside kinase (ribokinase family)